MHLGILTKLETQKISIVLLLWWYWLEMKAKNNKPSETDSKFKLSIQNSCTPMLKPI
jgi:hypothetical protein